MPVQVYLGSFAISKEDRVAVEVCMVPAVVVLLLVPHQAGQHIPCWNIIRVRFWARVLHEGQGAL